MEACRAKLFYTLNLQVKPSQSTLRSVNEKEELQAQKAYYEKVQAEIGEKRGKKLAFMKKLSIVYIPFLCLVFAILYWIIGLKQAEII